MFVCIISTALVYCRFSTDFHSAKTDFGTKNDKLFNSIVFFAISREIVSKIAATKNERRYAARAICARKYEQRFLYRSLSFIDWKCQSLFTFNGNTWFVYLQLYYNDRKYSEIGNT